METFGESAGGGFVAEELFGGCYGGGWSGWSSCEPPEGREEEAVGDCHRVFVERLSRFVEGRG